MRFSRDPPPAEASSLDGPNYQYDAEKARNAQSPTSAENAVVVELKQWSDGTIGPSTADNCVELSIGTHIRRVLHPSVQTIKLRALG